MFESFKFSKDQVMSSPDVPEALKMELSLMEKLKVTAGIDDDTDVDQKSLLARIDELMAEEPTMVRAVAESFVAAEYALEKNGLTDEVLDFSGKIANYILSAAHNIKMGEEEIEAFQNSLAQKVSAGKGYLDAFAEAEAERINMMSTDEELYLNDQGVVSVENERRASI
jgi:hypothetical protein